MFYTGQNITQSHIQKLSETSFSEIQRKMKNKENELYRQIQKLRKIKQIDRNVYQSLKKELPFFIGSQFRDNIRKTGNFLEINYFVIDIDHCFENEGQFIALRNELSNDDEIMAFFTSPGGDGLKLIYELEKPCRDTKIYSDFYKVFSQNIARKYNLEKYIDFVTSDVTRVCFLSYDPYLYYNPVCLKIKWEAWVPNSNLLKDPSTPEEYIEFKEDSNKNETEETKDNATMSHEIYADILKKLKTGRPPKKPKNYIVPSVLNTITDPISQTVSEYGFQIKEIRDINYGKKFIFTHMSNEAELNVFYGRKGFSVVKSPRTGTNPEMNDVLYHLVCEILYKHSVDLKEILLNTTKQTMINRKN